MPYKFDPFSYKSLLHWIYQKPKLSVDSEKKETSPDDYDFKKDPTGFKYMLTKPKNPEDDKLELSDYIAIFIFMLLIAYFAWSG